MLKKNFKKLSDFINASHLEHYMVMLSGIAFHTIIGANQEVTKEIFQILLESETVILYRSSPGEKAEVVKLIRKNAKGKLTAAIGDGANDVNMIQEAHVGIGIQGKEGNQASSFADYSVPRYKDLRRLLFWHGRGFGVRLGDFIIWALVKSLAFSSIIFFINIFNGFSGQQPVDSFIFAMFNVNMSTIALATYSVFDRDVSFTKYGHSDEAEAKMPFTLSELY